MHLLIDLKVFGHQGSIKHVNTTYLCEKEKLANIPVSATCFDLFSDWTAEKIFICYCVSIVTNFQQTVDLSRQSIQ